MGSVRTRRRAWAVVASVGALLGAPIVVLGAIYVSAVGTSLPRALVVGLACLAPLASCLVVARVSRVLGVVALVADAAAVFFLTTYGSSPLPRPEPFAGALPVASPPAGMQVFQVPTGRIPRTAAFGFRGGSFFEPRDFVMNGVLVRHPRGDLLIDTGLGREIDEQFQLFPFFFRVITPYERGRSAAEQLTAAGIDATRLRGILLTHAHWDHISGATDFPGVPLLLTAVERRFIDEGGVTTAIARSLVGARYELYDFDGGAYLGFDRSHDVFGDGSVVVVPAPGHSPGSVIVFVTPPGGRRLALVGDLAWQREGITEREERPWVTRRLVDLDAALVRASLSRMAAIAERFPEIILVPAHDRRGYEGLPRLPKAAGGQR